VTESCGMIKRLLTESELAEIAEARDDPEFKERFGRRLMAVRRHGLGVANSKIAGILRVSDDTVTNYLKLYRDEGLAGLVEKCIKKCRTPSTPDLPVGRVRKG